MLYILLTGCSQSPDDLRSEISELKAMRSQAYNDYTQELAKYLEIKREINNLEEKLEIYKHIEAGDTPKYILTLELRQVHYTLDIREHFRDAMNAVTFDIAVDEEFYNEQEVNAELLRSFRGGSFILNGTLGSWNISVVDKRIEYVKGN